MRDLDAGIAAMEKQLDPGHSLSGAHTHKGLKPKPFCQHLHWYWRRMSVMKLFANHENIPT